MLGLGRSSGLAAATRFGQTLRMNVKEHPCRRAVNPPDFARPHLKLGS